MLTMSANHPDIEEFIKSKQDLTKVTGANISVKVTDEFMKAVVNDDDYVLRYPTGASFEEVKQPMMLSSYNVLGSVTSNGRTIGYVKKVKARELWNTLMHCAWNTAEPKQNWAA